MRRYLSLYAAFFNQQLKSLLEYRANFFIGVAAFVLLQGASIATLWIVMRQVPDLNGWTLPEVLLIYGLVVLSRSFTHMFTANTWQAGGFVRRGGFDRFLVRPIDPLFHLLAQRFSAEGLGSFLVGFTLVVGAGRELGIFNSAFHILYLVVAVASGGLIFFGLDLLTCSSAFWIIDSLPVSGAVFENYLFAHYPLSIYPHAIQFMLTWVIPYGFASYYPASFLLGRDLGPVVFMGPVVAAVLLLIGLRCWQAGLRRYEGTGS
jgi:ABC-2 type transport system permease protein